MTATVYFGPGEIRRAGEILDQVGADSVFLVCGSGLFEKSGAERALQSALANRRVTRFSEFDPNPQLAELERGLEAFRSHGHQAILGVGGGTALDLAKLIGAFAAPDASPTAFLEGPALYSSRSRRRGHPGGIRVNSSGCGRLQTSITSSSNREAWCTVQRSMS